MKTQILVTLEFDGDALMAELAPTCRPPATTVIRDDINRELRLWVASNPYGLRDPEHLSLRLTLTTDAQHGTIEHKLATDLDRIAGDVGALARIVRQVC